MGGHEMRWCKCRVLLVGIWVAAGARRVNACCNVIPPAIQQFRASIASADRPFAGPGDWVELGSDGCQQTAGFPDAADQVVVSGFFTPPADGPVTAVILTPDACESPQVQDQLAACALALPPTARAVCRHLRTTDPPLDIEHPRTRPGDLRFRFP